MSSAARFKTFLYHKVWTQIRLLRAVWTGFTLLTYMPTFVCDVFNTCSKRLQQTTFSDAYFRSRQMDTYYTVDFFISCVESCCFEITVGVEYNSHDWACRQQRSWGVLSTKFPQGILILFAIKYLKNPSKSEYNFRPQSAHQRNGIHLAFGIPMAGRWRPAFKLKVLLRASSQQNRHGPLSAHQRILKWGVIGQPAKCRNGVSLGHLDGRPTLILAGIKMACCRPSQHSIQ